jgi:general secretion pathway protein G
MAKRNREIELRRNLRIIRNAIDDFKKTYDKAAEGVDGKKMMTSINKSGYPESFDVLIEGFDFGGILPEKKKFLRRVPCDPFREDNTVPCKESWGMRSYVDKPDSSQWGREDLYDVYSKSEDTAIDGSKYKDW